MKAAEQFDPWNMPSEAIGWDDPQYESDAWKKFRELERRNWSDMGSDIISFWRRGVEAAERGEEPEGLQRFLEGLDAEQEQPRRDTDTDGQHGRAGDWGWGDDNCGWDESWGGAPRCNAAGAGGWGGNPAPVNGWDVPPAAWDDWTGQRETERLRAVDPVWRYKNEDSCHSNSEAYSQHSRSQDLDHFVRKYSEQQSLTALRKDRLAQFRKMSTDEQVAKIVENIHQLRRG